MNKNSDLEETDQSDVAESNNLDIQVAIQMASNALQNQHESFDSVKNTAKTYLQTASLVMGLIGGLQLANPLHSVDSPYRFFFICMLVAYGISIGISLWLIAPVKIVGPVRAEWNVLQDQIVGKNNRDVHITYLNALTNAWESNVSILNKRISLVVWAGIVFAFMFVFLALMVFLN